MFFIHKRRLKPSHMLLSFGGGVQLFIMFAWLAFLQKTESYFVVYLLVGVGGFISWSENNRTAIDAAGKKQLKAILAALFSIAVAAANYRLYIYISIPPYGDYGKYYKAAAWLLTFPVTFYGGFLHAYNILQFLERHLSSFYLKKVGYTMSAKLVWLIVAILISCFNIIILFTCYYPGILTADSISQVTQCLNKVYSNHHPFYHSMIIKLFLSIGLYIFGNINRAVVLYSIFQILFMAGCFSYSIVTLYQMNVRRRLIAFVMGLYIFLPCHIFYSFTMWKDIVFGACILVFIVAMFRKLKHIGGGKMDVLLIGISSTGMCLFRSNGWFAFFLTFLTFVLIFKKTERKLCLLFIFVLLGAYVLKYPVLKYLQVGQPDLIESLSIPSQQIARVVKDYDDLTKEQERLLSEVIDLDRIPEEYSSFISDPIKQLVRQSRNQLYLEEHKMDFLKLYIQLGSSHPIKYLEAWIDQTSGYWNGGNEYWIWRENVCENTIGIESRVHFPLLKILMDSYGWYFQNINILRLFLSIGLHTWLMIGMLFMGIVRKDKVIIFLTIPVLAVLVTLLIATPVYSEFRYAYAMFCCVPFLIISMFWKMENRKEG